MKNALEIELTLKESVSPNSNVVFNKKSPYSAGISYDLLTGEIIITEAGNYSVRWWVATEASLAGCIQFALKSSQGDEILGCSSEKRGQVVGFGDISIVNAPVTLSLVNKGLHPVSLSKTSPVTAALSIVCLPDTMPITSTIPFSIGKYGVSLATFPNGEPMMITFSGFGSSYSDLSAYLQEGEWDSGTITMHQDMNYGSAFVMPHHAVLKKFHVLFSSGPSVMFESGVIIRPFACLAVSNPDSLVYDILQDTITYTDPYEGGVEYSRHTLRRGVQTNIDHAIPEGSLVAIIAGIRGENTTVEEYSTFSISGGLYFE